ncbi:MAG TPA: hypothetical protein VHN80_07685 [Kineosporiaceae bacterium]|nr:hypothetical protein [Kineosporiaceae bacterium]
MHSVILWTVVGSSLLLAVVGAVMSGLNRVAPRPLLAVTAIAELAAVVQSGVAAVELGGHHVVSIATFVGYLIGNVLVLPIAVVWAFADRNRWAGAVMAIGGFTVAVMTARLQMMWLGRA